MWKYDLEMWIKVSKMEKNEEFRKKKVGQTVFSFGLEVGGGGLERVFGTFSFTYVTPHSVNDLSIRKLICRA